MGILAKIFGRKSLGQWGEDEVASLYEQRGFRIVARNYFNREGRRLGEIDLVAVKDRMLVFVEVKTRTSKAFGSAAEAVTFWKQQRILKASKRFLALHREFSDYTCRIDVAEVMVDLDRTNRSVRILENAVEDNG